MVALAVDGAKSRAGVVPVWSRAVAYPGKTGPCQPSCVRPKQVVASALSRRQGSARAFDPAAGPSERDHGSLAFASLSERGCWYLRAEGAAPGLGRRNRPPGSGDTGERRRPCSRSVRRTHYEQGQSARAGEAWPVAHAVRRHRRGRDLTARSAPSGSSENRSKRVSQRAEEARAAVPAPPVNVNRLSCPVRGERSGGANLVKIATSS